MKNLGFQILRPSLAGWCIWLVLAHPAIASPGFEPMGEDFDNYKKGLKEDQRLALPVVIEVNDAHLTDQGSVNPVTSQCAVITDVASVRFYNDQGTPLKVWQLAGQPITCLAYSPDGSELLAGTSAGALLVWDVARETSTMLATNVGQAVRRVVWLGNNQVAWGGGADQSNQVAGAVLARPHGDQQWTFNGFVRSNFLTLAAGADGSTLGVLEIPGQRRAAFLLDGRTGKIRREFFDPQLACGPLSLALSSDGCTLAVGYAPNGKVLWDARSGEPRKKLLGHGNWVVSLAFSPDGRRIISGAGDSTARIWEADSGQEIGRIRFPGESTYVKTVGMAASGKIFFALAEGQLKVGRFDH